MEQEKKSEQPHEQLQQNPGEQGQKSEPQQNSGEEAQKLGSQNNQEKLLSAIVFGATGATGSVLIKNMLDSPKWGRIHIITRNMDQQWAHLHNKEKLFIQVELDFDELKNTEKYKLQGFDVMYICLGGDFKFGEEDLKKVDQCYSLACANIALYNKIPHVVYISSVGAASNSPTPFLRIKGQTELDLISKKLNMLTIVRPGLIKNRPHKRKREQIAEILSILHIIPAIDCLDLGKVLMSLGEISVEEAKNCEPVVKFYENQHLLFRKDHPVA